MIGGVFLLYLDGDYYRIFRGIFVKFRGLQVKNILIKIFQCLLERVKEAEKKRKKYTAEAVMPKSESSSNPNPLFAYYYVFKHVYDNEDMRA